MNGCLNPQLIYNQTALKILKVRPYIYTPDGIRHIRLDSEFRLPSDLRIRPVKVENGSVSFPSDNNLADCYGVENIDGSVEPLYREVPCGRCALCKNNIRNDWSCRAVVESNASHFVPLFVTLTYNDENLPADGVNKRDVQLFLKRLRKCLASRYPKFCDKKECEKASRPFLSLRYIGCSEYGKRGRAHYHLQLFNVPYVNNYVSHQIIESCWHQGFVYVVPCNAGSTRYITKYMCKPANIPAGQNKTFFMCSRGRGEYGGIGYQYVNDNSIPFDATYIELIDMWSTDKTPHKYAIPEYYKNKYWPSLSKVVDFKTRSLLNELNSKCFEFATYKYACIKENLSFDSVGDLSLFDRTEKVLSKVSLLYPFAPIKIPSEDDVRISVKDVCSKYYQKKSVLSDTSRFCGLKRYIDSDLNHESQFFGYTLSDVHFYVDWLKYNSLDCITFVIELCYWLFEDAHKLNLDYIKGVLSERKQRADYMKNLVKNIPDNNESKLERLNKELMHYEQIEKL